MIHEPAQSLSSSTSATPNYVVALFLTADGEEIDQDWQPAFVVFAFLIAFVASYVAVHLLDHSLWRTELEHEHAIITKPRTTAAVLLGFGTVWCMHFIGMAAVTLPDRPICYDWGITMGSLLAAVVFMIAGLQVASRDIFATPDRVQVLKDILIHRREVTHRRYSKKAMRQIFQVTCLEQLHYIFGGSFLAAAGATVMHYTGMMAMHGAFEMEWRPWWIVGSSIYAVVVCFVGFWIIFRLRWKVKDQWLRIASSAIIAAAVCGLHFGGMLSVHYIAVNDSRDVCQATFDQHNASPNAWTTHQLLIVAMAITVPLIAVLVENTITQELLLAHGANKDKAFSKLVRKLEGSGTITSHTSTFGQQHPTASSSIQVASMQRISSTNYADSTDFGYPSFDFDDHSVEHSIETDIFCPLEDQIKHPHNHHHHHHHDINVEQARKSTILEVDEEDEEDDESRHNENHDEELRGSTNGQDTDATVTTGDDDGNTDVECFIQEDDEDESRTGKNDEDLNGDIGQDTDTTMPTGDEDGEDDIERFVQVVLVE